jgi:amidase
MKSNPDAIINRRSFLAGSIGLGMAACSQPDLRAAARSSTLADVLARDALGQAALIRRKDIQPIELVEAVIGQIERLNPKLNAVVTKMYDLARTAAQGDIPDGPFRGVPFLLKDLIASYAGVRMAEGSRSQRDYVPTSDSELVARLKRAGLITVGKTNTPEFGMTATTEPHLFGATHNPWDLSRTPGGSSGGSAAAVAARILPMAHANDGGGSIRIPASACGLFGLKPTRGRNPLGPELAGIWDGIVAEHAVSLTVRDSAALLDATSGPVVGDPCLAPPKQRPFLKEVGAAPKRLRVAFSKRTLSGSEVHADCMAAVDDAARLLENLGHQVDEAAPRIDVKTYLDAESAIWGGLTAAVFEGVAVRMGRGPNPGWFRRGVSVCGEWTVGRNADG